MPHNRASLSFLQTTLDEEFSSYDQQIDQYQQKVIAFADADKEYGWKELINPLNSNERLKVPYRAFLHLCVHLSGFSKLHPHLDISLPPYTAIFPAGVKTARDNPLHTDCWLGAGMSIGTAYDSSCWQHQLFYHEIQKCQSSFIGQEMDFTILHSAHKLHFSGTTVNISNFASVPKGKRLLVLPHLGVEFEAVALQCDAIITEHGGKLAHLVTVGREMNIPIIRVEDAAIRFALANSIKIDLMNGKITSVNNVVFLDRSCHEVKISS